MKITRQNIIAGSGLLVAFFTWTFFVLWVDVKTIGLNGTEVGFATVNAWFHKLTGVHMKLYTITDWLGLVPIFVCFGFGTLGLWQLVKRRSLFKVDYDILLLGIYYVLVIFGYLLFEMIPINYRPVFINGYMEASYPSSTTLLVLGVMQTLNFQVGRRVEKVLVRKGIQAISICFSILMVMGRMFAGVHWFTDIVGAVLLGSGISYLYRGMVLWMEEQKPDVTVRIYPFGCLHDIILEEK